MFSYFLPHTSSLTCMSTMLIYRSFDENLMRVLTKVPSLLVCNSGSNTVTIPKSERCVVFLPYTVMHRDVDGVTGSVDPAHSVPFS